MELLIFFGVTIVLWLSRKSPDSLKMYVKVFRLKCQDICNLLANGSNKNIYDKANTAKYLSLSPLVAWYSLILLFPILRIQDFS